MLLKDRIRYFLALKFPWGFHRRNYERWKEILPEEMQELNSSAYLLLSSEKKTTTNELNEANNTFLGTPEQLDVSDADSGMVEALSNLNAENSWMMILIEKSIIKRNGLTVFRLLFQSFSLSFAVSFSLSFPALLQIVSLEFRLSLIKISNPLSFVLEPVIQMYGLLRYLSSFLNGLSHLVRTHLLFIMTEEWRWVSK